MYQICIQPENTSNRQIDRPERTLLQKKTDLKIEQMEKNRTLNFVLYSGRVILLFCFCLLFKNVQNLVFVFGCVLWRWALQIKLALAVQMCCLDVLDIARCLLLQPPMQCKKTWLCICKKKSSR